MKILNLGPYRIDNIAPKTKGDVPSWVFQQFPCLQCVKCDSAGDGCVACAHEEPEEEPSGEDESPESPELPESPEPTLADMLAAIDAEVAAGTDGYGDQYPNKIRTDIAKVLIAATTVMAFLDLLMLDTRVTVRNLATARAALILGS